MVELCIRCTLNGFYAEPDAEAVALAIRKIAKRQRNIIDRFDLLLIAEAIDPQGKTRRKLTIGNRKAGRPPRPETAVRQAEEVERLESLSGDGRRKKSIYTRFVKKLGLESIKSRNTLKTEASLKRINLGAAGQPSITQERRKRNVRSSSQS